MSDPFTEMTVRLPAEVIDALRGDQTRATWLEEAALRLARQQCGRVPTDALDWSNLHWEIARSNYSKLEVRQDQAVAE